MSDLPHFKLRYIPVLIPLVLDETLTREELAVLIVYLHHANDNGVAWPGVELIATRVPRSKATIRRIQKKLMERMLLAQKVRGGGKNSDGSPKKTLWELVMPESPTVANDAQSETVPTVANSGGLLSQKPAIYCRKKPAICDTNRSVEQVSRTDDGDHDFSGRGNGGQRAQVVSFLFDTCKLDSQKGLLRGAELMTLAEAMELWRQKIDAYPPGKERRAAMARAVMDFEPRFVDQ